MTKKIILEDHTSTILLFITRLLDNECPFVPLSMSGERYTAEVLAAAGVSYVVVDNNRCQVNVHLLSIFIYFVLEVRNY